MVERKIGGCENCQQDINYISGINRWPGLGAKTNEGAWCFGCFKNISHCQVCKKSVAQVEYNKHKPDPRLRWTVKPANGFEQHRKFICSQNCLDNYLEEKKRKRQERLNQGWKEYEGCVEKVNWLAEDGGLKWLKEKKHRSRFIKLVPPGQKLCGNYDYVGKGGCREAEEIGKPARQRAEVKAQNYWNSLSREKRLQEIERLDSVSTAKWWGKNYTAEEIAAWEKCPPDIVEEFCRHEMGESWEKIKNSRTANTQNQTLTSSETINEQITKKEAELQKIKENKGGNSEEVRKLEQEIQELLSKNQQKNNSTTENSKNPNENKIIAYSIVGFSLVALVGLVILLSRTKQKNLKIK